MPRLAEINPQTAAFLDMVAESEGTINLGDDGYNVLVGSTLDHPILFTSYAAHPDKLNLALDSTAAGRYQVLYRWWRPYQERLRLPDFSPENQDRVAIAQISEVPSALAAIHTGDLTTAISMCSHLWASLPGNNYGQHQQKVQWLKDMFTKHGGKLSC